ncbi:hypothetical protein BKA62DRAFT_761246 [Auriculariales sp. MPI-PUGE-AT-0066]|nr:hypothetical protein BKA62DRAFT_761246 [Auriculariales sp. MPI-PUGE-AT-0066]
MAQQGEFEVTYLATDPVIMYRPAVDDPSKPTGWTTTFSKGLAPARVGPSGAQRGVGDARRTTSSIGSGLQFSFFGRSVCVWGQTESMAWRATLDGQENYNHSYFAEYTDGRILVLNDLEPRWHWIRIEAIGFDRPESNAERSWLHIDRITFGTHLKWLTESGKVPCTDRTWRLRQDWWQDKVIGTNITFASTTTAGASAKITFDKKSPLHRARALFVYGTLQPGHGSYVVTLPVNMTANQEHCDRETRERFQRQTAERSAHSKFVVERALLWFGVKMVDEHGWSDLTITKGNHGKFDFVELEYYSEAPSVMIAAVKSKLQTWRGKKSPISPRLDPLGDLPVFNPPVPNRPAAAPWTEDSDVDAPRHPVRPIGQTRHTTPATGAQSTSWEILDHPLGPERAQTTEPQRTVRLRKGAGETPPTPTPTPLPIPQPEPYTPPQEDVTPAQIHWTRPGEFRDVHGRRLETAPAQTDSQERATPLPSYSSDMPPPRFSAIGAGAGGSDLRALLGASPASPPTTTPLPSYSSAVRGYEADYGARHADGAAAPRPHLPTPPPIPPVTSLGPTEPYHLTSATLNDYRGGAGPSARGPPPQPPPPPPIHSVTPLGPTEPYRLTSATLNQYRRAAGPSAREPPPPPPPPRQALPLGPTEPYPMSSAVLEDYGAGAAGRNGGDGGGAPQRPGRMARTNVLGSTAPYPGTTPARGLV